MFNLEPPPPPVGCKNCGTILHWILAAKYNYECPTCQTAACFICGCTDTTPCVRKVSNKDETNQQTYTCSWSKEGPCTFCVAVIAEQLYREATAAAQTSDLDLHTRSHINRDRYIDPIEWAKQHGITTDEAQQQLDASAELGKLEKLYLYEGSDSPITFLVTQEMLGESIKLSDLGYFEDEEDSEILVSPLRSRPVYLPVPDLQLLQTVLSTEDDRANL